MVLILWAFLVGCDAPDPVYRDVQPVRVSVGDCVFDVYIRGNLAEAVRVNKRYAPRLGAIRVEAARAMAQVSGCRVYGVLGDQAQLTGFLTCKDHAA